MTCKLILGSASERRAKILGEMGYSFDVVIPEVEEVFYADDPEEMVEENALRKNEWCSEKHPDAVIITADTILDFEGKSIVKPVSIEEAYSFFQSFSGKAHTVLTAVGFHIPDKMMEVVIDSSEVKFKKLADDIIKEYFSKVDPLDKAGAYDIDQHSDLIIDSYTGSHTNIMGLPEEIVRECLDKL